ncbi:hypothetical protein CDIK_0641 [Cucumispora dikerogammari]|nr:hypothetical protein CDIK_0641 [Cucumispora dikerogammari]
MIFRKKSVLIKNHYKLQKKVEKRKVFMKTQNLHTNYLNTKLLNEMTKTEASEIKELLQIQQIKLEKIKNSTNETIYLMSITERLRLSLKSKRIVLYLILLIVLVFGVGAFFIFDYFRTK